MEQKSYTCIFGGEAGYGVMSAGATVAKAAMRNGLWSFVVNEYPSLIKGGLNTCITRLSDHPLTGFQEEFDFLGVLSQPAFDGMIAKACPGAAVLYDSNAVTIDTSKVPAGVRLIAAPLIQSLAGDAAKVMANSALLGAFCALSGFPANTIVEVMVEEFADEKIRRKNLEIFENSYESAIRSRVSGPDFSLGLSSGKRDRMLLTGNDAICMGAIKAGCKFAAGYPMTPASSILNYMADHGPQYGVVFKQTEDEIAAINMLIGASFAGVRTLGATSGGGFALMVEALGFAGQAEIPLVIVEAQRGGPSTGLPTRTMQADLNFVVHASQGEFPRFVMAPGDVEECFYETFRMFNLAERFQVPCIILTDKYLADSAIAHPLFDMTGLAIDRGSLAKQEDLTNNQPYLRYQITEDGVSLRAIPGQSGGRHMATSYTHGEDGFYSSGNHEYAGLEPEVTTAGIDKAFRKIPLMEKSVPGIKLYGSQEADITVVGWGSTKGAILEAMANLLQEGIHANFLQVLYPSPFPAAAVQEVLAKAKQTLLVEGNKTAQLGGMIRANTGYELVNRYLKYDSRPFTAAAIAAKIKEVLTNGRL